MSAGGTPEVFDPAKYVENGFISLALFFLNFAIVFLFASLVFRIKQIKADAKAGTSDMHGRLPALSDMLAHTRVLDLLHMHALLLLLLRHG